MANISVEAVRSLSNYLVARGADRARLLQDASLSEARINGALSLIDTKSYEQLYLSAERQLGDFPLGFEYGQQLEAEHWGVLGQIAFSSKTLADALDSQNKYQSIVGNVGTPTSDITDGILAQKWLPAYRYCRHVAEEIITGWVALSRKLTQMDINPTRVCFTHAVPSNPQAYQDYFQAPVEFEADYNGISVSAGILSAPLCRYNPELNRLLKSYADYRLAELNQTSPMAMVKDYIRVQLPKFVPELEDAANYLNISSRALQRKLAERELTYSALLNQVRQELATNYLINTDTKLVYISEVLGFSEQSAFNRAFKRWTGESPVQFRRRHRESHH